MMVMLRSVRVAILAMENNKYYIFRVCVCSVRYPECNAHAPYCHLWPAQLYNFFPHYLKNCTVLGENKELLWTQNVCLDFPYKFCPELIPRIIQ